MSKESYEIVCPFWIDTEAYSDRDRDMFTAGFEFSQIVRHLEEDDGPMERPIHPENESRARMAAGRFGRNCRIDPLDDHWRQLHIKAKS